MPSSVTNAVAVAAGRLHSLVLLDDGSVVAWGYNEFGQTDVPTSVTNVVAVAAGDYHNFILRLQGDPLNPDTDGDGINDGVEVGLGLDPVVSNVGSDLDGDGLGDLEEVNDYATNPLNPDSDGDTISDGDEASYGLNPLVSNTGSDLDGDGLFDVDEVNIYETDPTEPDSDYDGLDDAVEVANAGRPLVSDQWIIDHIRDHGDEFDLYSLNSVLDIAIGQAAFSVSNGMAELSLQLEESDDLIIWTNAGDEVIWDIPVDADKSFYRVRSSR